MDFLRAKEGDCIEYYFTYIRKVPEGDLIDILTKQRESFGAFIDNIPPAQQNFAYAPGKWTVKETLQHIFDTEHVFSYRLRALVRNEKTPIPGFEQDDYVEAVDVSNRKLNEQKREFQSLRNATIALVESITPGEITRCGQVSGHPMCARAIPAILAGHVIHHEQVLHERYGL